MDIAGQVTQPFEVAAQKINNGANCYNCAADHHHVFPALTVHSIVYFLHLWRGSVAGPGHLEAFIRHFMIVLRGKTLIIDQIQHCPYPKEPKCKKI